MPRAKPEILLVDDSLSDLDLIREALALNLAKRGAKLIVRSGGKQYESRVTAIKGDADKPFTAEEVAAKFMRYAGASMPAGKAYDFAAALVSCEKDAPFRSLWDLLL